MLKVNKNVFNSIQCACVILQILHQLLIYYINRYEHFYLSKIFILYKRILCKYTAFQNVHVCNKKIIIILYQVNVRGWNI